LNELVVGEPVAGMMLLWFGVEGSRSAGRDRAVSGAGFPDALLGTGMKTSYVADLIVCPSAVSQIVLDGPG
jgi:hypothetical protein